MFKNKIFSLFKYNTFTYGEQKVSQFIIFECKYLFSIMFFYFHKANSCQDRFHTHAFNAFSIKLFGQYSEYILEDEKTGIYHIEIRKNIFKYFPRSVYHKIGNSKGCCTLLFSGPWLKEWKEYNNGVITYYNWGRNEL